MNKTERTKAKLIDYLEDNYSISRELIMSDSRRTEAVTSRQLIMYLFRKDGEMTLEGVADVVNRTHATIIFGVREIENRLHTERNGELKAALYDLREIFKVNYLHQDPVIDYFI